VVFNRRNDEFYAHYKAGTLDIHDYVRFATDAVPAGREARAAHAEFMREVVQPGCGPRPWRWCGSTSRRATCADRHGHQ
jgi:hypothetical protein